MSNGAPPDSPGTPFFCATSPAGAALSSSEPYGVIHRIASYLEVHGVFSAIIDFAAARYPHLRIDTHRDNRIMQHLIDAAGFSYCGIIWLEDGTERLAYER